MNPYEAWKGMRDSGRAQRWSGRKPGVTRARALLGPQTTTIQMMGSPEFGMPAHGFVLQLRISNAMASVLQVRGEGGEASDGPLYVARISRRKLRSMPFV